MTEVKTNVSEAKEVQNALPWPQYNAGWTGVPNTIFENYSFHPKFTGACLRVYMFLLHRYNQRYGYAYPTQDQMADDLCLSRSAVKTAIKSLKELELIETERNPDHSNDVYFLKRPIANRTTFELKFPEAKAKRIRHEESREKDKRERHETKAAFEAKRKLAREGLL